MDSIADQAEVRRYVDTLNGACFSLGCTMTRLSARVGVYLLAPAGMQVYTDRTTTQMNAQSRAPQRANPGMQQSAFQSPFAPQQGQMPYGQAAYQQPVNPFAPPQPVYAQPQQPAFSEQQPSQGYIPDHEGAGVQQCGHVKASSAIRKDGLFPYQRNIIAATKGAVFHAYHRRHDRRKGI